MVRGMTPSRIDDAIRFLGEEVSATRDEFLQAHYPGGDMLLTGLQTGGYLRQRDGRMALSGDGLRRLEAVHGHTLAG
jgi:hypothetical protein